MNPFILETALRIAGLILSGLVVANFLAPKRFNYCENLAGAGVFVRQVFYVHCAYIIAIIVGLALLCLGWPELLLTNRTGVSDMVGTNGKLLAPGLLACN